MSLHKFAEQVAANGRGEDSLLVHMTPDEVQRLQTFAQANGRSLTINPDTGLPEAGMLSDLFKAIAPIALGAFLGPAGLAMGGGFLTAAQAGMAVGGIATLATGSLSRGLMAGLGAYGGAGLADSFMNAGASTVGNVAGALGVEGAATGAGSQAAMLAAQNAGFGTEGLSSLADSARVAAGAAPVVPSTSSLLSSGAQAAMTNPMQFAKDNWKYLAGAAAPIAADMMTPTTTKMPDLGNTGYIRQKVYDPYTQTYRDMAPVRANEWGDRQFSDIHRGYNNGGIVALAVGGNFSTVQEGDKYDQYDQYDDGSAAAASAAAASKATADAAAAAAAAAPPQGLDTSGIAGLKLNTPFTQYTNEQIGGYLAANQNVDIQQAIKDTNADPAAVNAYINSLRNPFIASTDTTGGSGTTGIYNQMKAQGIDPTELYTASTALDPNYAGYSQEAITNLYNLQTDANKLSSTLGNATSDKDWVNLMDTGKYSVNDVAQTFGLSTKEVQARYDTVKQTDATAAAAAAAAAKKKTEDDAIAAAAAAAAKKKAEEDAIAAAAIAAAKKKAEEDAAIAAAKKKAEEEAAALAAIAAEAAAKKKAEEDAAVAAAKKKADEEAAALAAIAAAKKKAEDDAAALAATKRTTCPAPEMRILLASGELKAAGELQVGDVVRTQHEHTLEWGDYPVTHVSVVPNVARLKFKFDDVDFVCSLDHKFFKAADKWVDAKDVCVGDMLSGQTLRGIEQAAVGDVVRITIDDAHTYICESLLSHNKSPTLTAEEIAANKLAADKKAADKFAADKAAADKFAADKAAADKIIADKAAADKIAADKIIADKAAADKIAADKIIADKAAADAVAKIARDKAIADKAAADKIAADKVIADAAVAAKIAAEKAAADAAAKALAEGKTLAEATAAAAKAKLEADAIAKTAADKAAADAAAAANVVTSGGIVDLKTDTDVKLDKTDNTSTGISTLATTKPGAITSDVTTDGTYIGTTGTAADVGTKVGQGIVSGTGTETSTGTTGPIVDYGGTAGFKTAPITLAQTQLTDQAAAKTTAQNKQLDQYRGFVAQNPNATDVEHARYLDKLGLNPDVASSATSLSPQEMKNRYYDAKYNRMTGDSQSAYNFLMGKGAYPTKSGVGEIMRPYKEATLGMPASTNQKYIFDPATKSYKLNQDFVGSYRDAKGAVNYTMSQREVSDYFKANPGQADSTTYDWAIENGVSPEQIAASTGVPLPIVTARWRAAKQAKDAKAGITALTKSTTDGGGGPGSTSSPSSNTGNTISGFNPAAPNPSIAESFGNAPGSTDGNTGSTTGTEGGAVASASGGLQGYALGGGLGALGSYSDGGRLLRGPGDGVSDSIPATIGAKSQPARLADGEFVVPARIVSELGNGSTDAGAKKLYAMLDRVQRARGKTTGKDKVAANSRADKYLPA